MSAAPTDATTASTDTQWARVARFVGADRIVIAGVDHALRVRAATDTGTATDLYAADAPLVAVSSGPGSDAKRTACLSEDRRLVLHDLDSGAEWRLRLRIELTRPVLAFSPDERFLAVAAGERIVILDLEPWGTSAPQVTELTSSETGLTCVAFSPDGAELLACAGRSLLRWSVTARADGGVSATASAPLSLAGAEESVLAARLSSDGASLAVVTAGHSDAGVDRAVRVHVLSYPPDSDGAAEAAVYDLTANVAVGAPARLAAVSPDLSRVAVAFADHCVIVWADVSTADLGSPTVHDTEFPILSLSFGAVGDALHLLVVQGTRTDVRRIEPTEDYALY